MASRAADGGAQPATRLTRRAWIGAVGAAAGVTVSGGLVTGCDRSVLPSIASPHVDLVFSAYPWTGTTAELLSRGAAEFTQAVRGVRLRVVPGSEDARATASAILAGAGPDVLWATDYGVLTEAGALLPLDELVARDRVDVGQWPSGKVAMLRSAGQMFGLPAYTAAMCYALRLQDWDDVHAERPAPTWTHKDFQTEAQRLTRDKDGGHRYGACVQWYSTGLGDNAWLFRGFGGTQTGPDGASSTLGTPQAVGAGRWVYDLLWAGHACTVDLTWQGVGLVKDGVSMIVAGPWTVAGDAATYGGSSGDGDFQWDYYPFPAFPEGRATYANTDFFAVSSRTAHPEAAWTLLKWVATDPSWQRWLMRVGLLPPGVAALWDQWEAEVRAAAPPLRDKALHWFSDAARGEYAYPEAYYRYRSADAQAVADRYVAKLWNRQITDVQPAFAAADAAINALLNAAAVQATASAAATRALTLGTAKAVGKVLGPPDGNDPPPETTGLLTVGPAGFALAGNGAGLGGPADAGAFASTVSVDVQAECTCQVTSLRNVDGPYLNDQALVALMARASLAADAPFVAVGVTGADGLQAWIRPAAGLPPYAWSAADHTRASAFAVALATGASSPTPAIGRTHPLWLKLRRDGAAWTCLASADGRAWFQVGPALTLPIAGCWVGVFASSHNGSPGFHAGEKIAVTIPDCTPPPQRAIQLGSP